ncbi:MAG TPA: cupin domain-containing protein [Candidatus Limnocylindrales bacterium]
MPIEVRRFGAGHRRAEGPPGTRGLTGQVVHADARGHISELAFSLHGRIPPHDNPNTTWFLVIEGGGWVEVGGEQARVAAGDAVLWPAGIDHAAWTDGTTMRAIVVELAGPDDAHLRGILEGRARRLLPAEAGRVAKGQGSLSRRAAPPAPDPESEEPR